MKRTFADGAVAIDEDLAHHPIVRTLPAVTAQSVYANMLRREIAPGLRALGFRGSGSKFVLPRVDWWQIVAFQKDYHSDAEHIRFTVNLTVANKAAWAADREYEPSLPVSPSGNTSYWYETEKRIRLGNLMPPRGEDRWWDVIAGVPTDPVAELVVSAIERRALPWFRTECAAAE